MQLAVQTLGEDFEVIAVPTRYPAGGAKQLIRVLTGKEVPAGKRSTDLGVQCFNVATAYTAYRAIAYGEPVISRIVTLTGNVATPRNWEVLIGTPLGEFIKLGQPKADTNGYLMGGPMMGFEMPGLDAPLVKATNCIIAGSPTLFPPKAPEMPCIRCGECAKACPHELQPFEMYWFARAKNFGKTQEYNIFDCIECGCCSYVCPSHIPLVQYFRFAKSEIWAREAEKKASDAAKARFEFRNLRDEREKAEKAERLAKAAAAKAAEKKAAPAESDAAAVAEAPVDADAAKKAAIAAAIERARVQREAAEPKNTDGLTIAQRNEIAEIEARRAPLQAAQAVEAAEPIDPAAPEQHKS
jgi:electron transport complex protein RnfC